jgi:tetratricopeptide (TPR) repeat protein
LSAEGGKNTTGLSGRSLGGFKLREVLGSGAMAVVYLAWDEQLERDVAVKVLHQQIVSDPDFIARFKREAKIAASLDHPNIVSIYAVGVEDEDIHYFVMNYLRGGCLIEPLKKKKRLTFKEAAPIMRGILQGLAYAHSNNVIHRDIKPDNIMFDSNGNPVISDFGIAKALGQNLTRTGTSLGTPSYMAPEQVKAGLPVTFKADIYATGVLFYQLLTGVVPFPGNEPIAIGYKHVHAPPPPLKSHYKSISDEVEKFVLKALEKAAEDRYESATEMLEYLDRLERGEALGIELKPFEEMVPRSTVVAEIKSSMRQDVMKMLKGFVALTVLAIILVAGYRKATDTFGPVADPLAAFAEDPLTAPSPTGKGHVAEPTVAPTKVAVTVPPVPTKVAVTEPPAPTKIAVTEPPTKVAVIESPTKAVVAPTPTPTKAVVPEPPTKAVVAPTPTPTKAVVPEPPTKVAVTPTPTPTKAVVPEPPTKVAVTPTSTPTKAVVPEPPTKVAVIEPPTKAVVAPTPTKVAVTPTPTPTRAVVPEPPTKVAEVLTRAQLIDKGKDLIASGMVKDGLEYLEKTDWNEKNKAEYRELRDYMVTAASSYLDKQSLWPSRLLMEFVSNREPTCTKATFVLAKTYLEQKKIEAAGNTYLAGFKSLAAGDYLDWLKSTRDELVQLDYKGKLAIGELLAQMAEETFSTSPSVAKILSKEALNFSGDKSMTGHFIFGRVLLSEGNEAEGWGHIKIYASNNETVNFKKPAVDLEQYLEGLEAQGDLNSQIALKRAQMAKRAFNQHQFATSKKLYSQICKTFPAIRACVSYYFMTAAARLMSRGENEKARELLVISVRFDESNLEASKLIGDTWLEEGNFEKVKIYYTQALGKL